MPSFPMDELYKKLHERYSDLKKRKFSELDEMGKDQEVRFLEYVSANEDMIQHLEKDRERLRTENCSLRSEINILISKREEEHAVFETQLLKVKEEKALLQDQIEEFRTLTAERVSSSLQDNDEFFNNRKIIPKAVAKLESCASRSPTSFLLAQDKETATPLPSSRFGEGLEGLIKEREFDKTDYFQQLLEILVGMKFTHVKQADGSAILAMHQSSGYAFKLKWINIGKGEEAELLYCVSTLGTFEPIAPEWMRSTLKFGIRMCPIFFKRISRVVS